MDDSTNRNIQQLSELESRTLVENSPDTIARYDRECRRLYVNAAFAAVAEGGAAALLGKRPTESPGGPHAATYEEKIREVFATGKHVQFELKWPGKDGKEMCSHIRLVPEFDASGKVITVQGVGRDITDLNQSRSELARTAEALRMNEEMLLESQLAAGLGSYTVNFHYNSWEASKGLEAIYGIDASYDRSSQSWYSLLHPDDRQRVRDTFDEEVVRQGKPFDMEFRLIRHNDGAVRWMHGMGRLERDDQGRPLLLHGTVQDITERKHAEQQLNDLLAFNRTIVEKSPAGIAVYRADGPCIMVNEAYAHSLGGTIEGFMQQNFRTSESWQRNGLTTLAERAFASDAAVSKDVTGTTTFGKTVSLNCTFAPVVISGSKHLLLITNDVSEQIAARKALTESMRQLEEKELAKTRFLAAAGHDLRQPLAAANLYIDALKFAGLNENQHTIVQRLKQSMSTFNGLLDALLNISRLDAGIIKPECTAIQVSELMNWIDQNFTALAANKGLQLRLHFTMREPLALYSDIGLVKSVLMNLITNAIKFTRAGGILVSARRRGDQVLIQIWDTGIGIQPEHLSHIFEEFYQVDNPQRDRTSGLGLGLSIARRALLLLDGNVTCRSVPGHGSVFCFTLPVYDAPVQAAQPALHADAEADNLAGFIRGKRFVVLEDDKLVSQAMVGMLEGMGAEVRHFYSAEEALLQPRIEQADCYIVDYMLGGAVNGTQFLGQVRAMRGEKISAVLMTGDTSTATLRLAQSLEWPVLHKPINASQLIACLRRQQIHKASGSPRAATN